MGSPRKGFRMMHRLSISTGIAIAAIAVSAAASQAQMRGGDDVGGAARGPAMTRGGPVGGAGPQLNRFGTGADDLIYSRRIFGRGKGAVGRGVATGETTPDDDRPRRPPHRRPRGKWPPGWYPGGPGVGVVIGPVGPGAAPPSPPPAAAARRPTPRASINIPPANERRFVKDEVVLEFAGNFSPQVIAQLLARHRLTQLEAERFTLTDATLVRARIDSRRSVRAVLRGLRNERGLRAGQPNYLYLASQQGDAGPAATIGGPTEATPKPLPIAAAAGALPAVGDPAQYALAKLRLNEAHRLATGDRVLVAVIDSGIDADHPELQGVIDGSYDALGGAERPHAHGTAIAGVIAAHARLMGAAPSARILAIRAFGSIGGNIEATTFAILKGIDYAVARNARVINMSFAGPADPGLARQLAAANARGAVLIAASGNLGPKSPPQYPAADPNVIAVSATDPDDKLFKASNVGRHITVAAPGVDILLPAPNNGYQVSSGTSYSAAYVSGVAALLLQRAPDLAPDAVRRVLQATAKDLGPRGRDKQYGAGLVDAYEAVAAVEIATAKAPLPLPRPASAR